MVDDRDRLLLFSAGRRCDATLRWFAPGGGIEPAEAPERAAAREVAEETGLVGVRIGPEVWRGRPWTTIREGIAYEVRQRYFLARVTAFDVDTSGFEALERSEINGFRWWSAADLAATSDRLRPDGLAGLFADLLADGPPTKPIVVSG
jgi:8-oxo-dGTP pyrophosphatase MutT (NUDIX family)